MPSELLFFLGAGASVPARVPDTIHFVREFRSHCSTDPTQLHTLDAVLAVLEKWKRDTSPDQPAVDIELLLEALTRLDAKESDLLLRFFGQKQFLLAGEPPKQPLIQSLKRFIKAQGIVPEDRINYLTPMIDFSDEYHPLDIFTANYDITVEQFCNKFRKTCVDGFVDGWDSRVFQRSDVDIRLYKIHGSVTWYRTNKGRYIKMLASVPETEIQLVTGEQADTLILYPVPKWEYAEPFLETLVFLKSALESARFAIVAGYSFRDEHLRKIFWDASQRNRDLRLLLVDPSAHFIYQRRLKFYEPGVASPLADRVITLPYRFEKVLPLLRKEFIANLKIGLASYKAAREKELKGETPTWITCLEPLAVAEHFTLLEEVLSKCDADRIQWQTRMETLLSLLAAAILETSYDRMAHRARELHRYLYDFFAERLYAEVKDRFIELSFNYVDTNGGSRVTRGAEVKPALTMLHEYVITRHAMGPVAAQDLLSELNAILLALLNYLDMLDGGRISARQYLKIRERECSSKLTDLLHRLIEPEQGTKLSERFALANQVAVEVMSLEESILSRLLNRILALAPANSA